MRRNSETIGLTAGLVIATSAGAAVINPRSATTTMGSGFGTLLQNTINGIGLSPFPSLSGTHAGTTPTNSWVSSTNVRTGSVRFDLGADYTINGFSFWNQNAGGPGAAGSTGIQGVDVEASLDGVNFQLIAGAPEIFERAMESTSEAQGYMFAPVNARYIRFNIQGNYGDVGQTGFAEVAFSGVPVPEPAHFWMLPSAAALLRRRPCSFRGRRLPF